MDDDGVIKLFILREKPLESIHDFVRAQRIYVYSDLLFISNRRIVPFLVTMSRKRTYKQYPIKFVTTDQHGAHFLFTFLGSMIFPRSFNETFAEPRSNGFG